MIIDLKYNSPDEEITDALFEKKKVSVSIKRDDLIHPFISGNKWRKLKYTLCKAICDNKKHLVTFGGAYSNHLLATACAAAKFGFKSTGVVRGETVENNTLMLCRMFGMNLIFTDRSSYRDKPAVFNKLFGDNSDAFFIDEGGSGPEAILGCAEMVDEFEQSYDHIFCASGTGTTAAGILKGLQSKNIPTILHSVSVFKEGSFIRQDIEQHFDNCPPFNLHLDYHFGGYAKTRPELIQFIQRFSGETGILLDPVYTGKMLYAVYDLIRRDYFAPGSKILAVHTGGLLGLLGMDKKIYQALL